MWTFGKIIMFLESCWNSLNWQIRWRYYNFCVVMQWCNFNLILIKMIKTAKRSDSFHPLSHLHFHITKYFFSKNGTLFNFLIPFFKIWHTSTCQAVIYLIISIWIFFFHFAVTAWFDITALNFIMVMLIKKTRMHFTKDSGELRWGRPSWPGWSKWGKCNWNLYGINRAQVMLTERELMAEGKQSPGR